MSFSYARHRSHVRSNLRHAWAIGGLAAALFVAGLLLAPTQASAQCTVCQSCSSAADCGAGMECYDYPGFGFICTQSGCTTNSCPGDSVCYHVTFGNGAQDDVCLNPTASTQFCPSSYTCFDDGQACSGLGHPCPGGPSECSAVGSSLCLTLTIDNVTSSFCSCTCAVDGDCGAGNRCVALSGGDRACRPADISGLCANVTCGSGEVCEPNTGNCVPDGSDLCGTVTCASDQVCSPATGTCIGGSGDVASDTVADTSAGDTSAPTPDTATAPADTTAATDTATTAAPDMYSADTTPTGWDTGTTTTPATRPANPGSYDNDTSCGCASLHTPARRQGQLASLVLLFGALSWVVRRRS